jgi:hypothetical protein
VFESRFTGLGNNAHLAMEAVKNDLTRNIGSTLNALQDEMRWAAEQNIGTCEDWTPILPYPVLARIVALISGRVFVGLPFSRNEDWLQISINFTLVSFGAAVKFSTYPAWMRPFVVPFLDVTRAIHKQRAKAVRLLTPVIQERLKATGLPEDQKPNDMIQWAMEDGKGKPGLSIEEQAELQLTLSMAAIRTYLSLYHFCSIEQANGCSRYHKYYSRLHDSKKGSKVGAKRLTVLSHIGPLLSLRLVCAS